VIYPILPLLEKPPILDDQSVTENHVGIRCHGNGFKYTGIMIADRWKIAVPVVNTRS